MTMFVRSRSRAAGALLGMCAVALSLAASGLAAAAETIRVATPYQATTLDPMRSASSGNLEVYGQLYARLLHRDGVTLELQPGLAERWEISEDGKTYTFHLRDAKFSDGSPLTAEDVAFSLERVRTDKESAYPAPLSAVESVTATDPRTVTVNLKSSFAPFLANVEIWNMGIVSKADVENRGPEKAFTEAPLASGPYMVQEWRPNERLVLAPNPNYWREGYPKSDATVEFIEVASPETRVAMLKSGEADAVRGVQWSQIADLKATEGVDMRLEPSTTIYVVLLNSKREPFSNTTARRAAAHAVDNKAITQAVTLGNAEPANTTLPRVDFHDDAHPGIAYDPARAKQLLQESGMEGAEVQILATSGAAEQQLALLLQAQWQAIGLKPVITNVDTGAWWDATGKGDYDAAATWWYNEVSDPDLAVRWALCGTCGSDSYNTFYNNEQVNQLVEQGTAESDPAKRAEIYKEIQRITTEEVSQIPLYYAPNAVAYSKRVSGLRLTPALQWTFEETTFSQ